MGTTFNKVSFKKKKKKLTHGTCVCPSNNILNAKQTQKITEHPKACFSKLSQYTLVFLSTPDVRATISNSITVSCIQVFLLLVQFLPTVVTTCHFRA